MFLCLQDEKSVTSQASTDRLVKWLNSRKIRSFYVPFKGNSLREGTQHLMQVHQPHQLTYNLTDIYFFNSK